MSDAGLSRRRWRRPAVAWGRPFPQLFPGGEAFTPSSQLPAGLEGSLSLSRGQTLLCQLQSRQLKALVREPGLLARRGLWPRIADRGHSVTAGATRRSPAWLRGV